MRGSWPPGPIAPIRGMVWDAGPVAETVGGTVVGPVMDWPSASNKGDGTADADSDAVGKIVVVVDALLVVELPRTRAWPSTAAAGTLPSRTEPAAPAAAAPASLSRSRRLCDDLSCPLPFWLGGGALSSASSR